MNTSEVACHNIKRYRSQLGLTQKELAVRCGWAVSTISNYERSDRKPGLDEIDVISKALGISSSQLIGIPSAEKGQYLTNPIGDTLSISLPIIEYDSLPSWRLAITESESSIRVPKSNLINHHSFITPVKNSANPPLSNGDLIVISPDIKPEPKDLVVANTPDGPAVGRYMARTGGVFELKPIDDAYPSYELEESEIIGTLVYEMRAMVKR